MVFTYHLIETYNDFLPVILSFSFYASSFAVLVICSILPFRWFVMLLISCVFIANHAAFSNLSFIQDILQGSSKTDNVVESGEKEAEKKGVEGQPLPGSSKVSTSLQDKSGSPVFLHFVIYTKVKGNVNFPYFFSVFPDFYWPLLTSLWMSFTQWQQCLI